MEKTKAFLNCESDLIKNISELESKRLEDLKNSRENLYKYALPSSIIDGIIGGLSTFLTGNFIFIVPTILFLILIYLLALTVDFTKLIERMGLIAITEKHLEDMKAKIDKLKEYE